MRAKSLQRLRGAVGCWLLVVVSGAWAEPIAYSRQTLTEPRPLQAHILKIDLTSDTIEPVVIIAPDPDGAGLAESQGGKPLTLAQGVPGLLAAVNANAFGEYPPPPSGRTTWRVGLPMTIVGWARTPDREASSPHHNYYSFWIDETGRARTGNIAAAVPARWAVAGFGGLARDGQALDRSREPLHPRTAIGANAAGTTVWLVVVDGRRPGYSEGMSTGELAEFMIGLGCANAINLDGGGSSVFILADPAGTPRIVNRPSTPGTRPVPVLFGVRRK